MIEDRIKRIILKHLVVKRICFALNVIHHDLEADSLDPTELIMEFEDAFKINIPDEDTKKMQNIGDVVNYIEVYTRKEYCQTVEKDLNQGLSPNQ